LGWVPESVKWKTFFFKLDIGDNKIKMLNNGIKNWFVIKALFIENIETVARISMKYLNIRKKAIKVWELRKQN
jgi:hypothetical protein